MTHALLEADEDVPWSAVRRPRTASEERASVRATVHLSQIRRLFEQASDTWERRQRLTGGATSASRGSAAEPSLLVGAAAFGGFRWRVALVCCPEEPAERDELAGLRGWRLGLQVAATPLLGDHFRQDEQSLAIGGPANASLTPSSPARRLLFDIGKSKASAAATRHCPVAAAAAGGGHSDCQDAAASAAFDVAVSVALGVGEHAEVVQAAAAAAGARHALLLNQACNHGAPRGWCTRAGPESCGLCRRGTIPNALQPAGDDAAAAFHGWQPERWSALAPAGQLHWCCALRLLTDY